MNCIGLVVFSEENEINKKYSAIKRILFKLKRFFNRKLDGKAITKICTDEGLEVCFIKLPYVLNEIKNVKHITQKKIQSIISKACMDNSIEKCMLPRCTPPNLNLIKCIINPFSGDFIYKALIINILEQVSQKRKVNIRDFNLAIINGSNHDMLNFFIEILSPLVKYVTIITREKEVVEEKMEEILDETGLAVRITSDLKNGADEADLLINLEDTCNLPAEIRMGRCAVVVNFGKETSKEYFDGCVVINGVNAVLNHKFKSILNGGIYEYYSSTELSEIIIIHELKLEVNIFNKFTDYTTMAKISKQFRQNGYSIADIFE
ncbi:MAG: hypothetical protein GX660_25905 [Clostridiaceae bacterium]|nr:hypothetical protein [Clostridiaceae bacterium]